MFIRIIDGYIVYYHPVLTGAWGVKCLGSLTSDVTGCKLKKRMYVIRSKDTLFI